jgi:diguanylate cyclase (GGDEF)-like protein
LILELTKTLRKECEFNKMGIYIRSEDSSSPLIAVNWQIRDNIDKLLRENFEFILERLNPGETYDRKSFFDIFQDSEVKFDSILNNELEYFTSIPWFDKRQAFMVWNGSVSADKITGRLQDFWRGALPLVEYTSRFEKANEMSYTDGLTGVYNRRYFQQRLTEELHRAKRYGRTLTLLILDVDDLKLVNDTYGHPAGDQLLKTLARVLSESVRSIDLISRYGGDEFCLIMPETGRNRARLLMNRIKSKIESSPLMLEGVADVRHYSVSIGGAVFPTDADSFSNLFLAADKALLAAKSDGRNCSRLFESEIEFKTSNNQ